MLLPDPRLLWLATAWINGLRVGANLLLMRHQAGLITVQKAQIWTRDGASSPGRRVRRSAGTRASLSGQRRW